MADLGTVLEMARQLARAEYTSAETLRGLVHTLCDAIEKLEAINEATKEELMKTWNDALDEVRTEIRK